MSVANPKPSSAKPDPGQQRIMAAAKRLAAAADAPQVKEAFVPSPWRWVLRAAGLLGMLLVVLLLALLYPVLAIGREGVPWGQWLSQLWGQGLWANGEQWLLVNWTYGWLLWGLLLVPPLLWWTTFGQDRRRPRLRMGMVAPLRGAPRGLRVRLRDLPALVRVVAIAFSLLALARPVMVMSAAASTTEEGIDIVVVMDLSGSMMAVLDANANQLPRKFRPKKGQGLPTRLDTAKLVVQDFVSRRKTDRIGVIVFGRRAYILSPPTLDYALLNKLVGGLSLSVIDGSKTAIGDALATAVARLRNSDARSKVIILLTDGDNNAGKVSPDLAVELASKHGCKIYTIQIGDGAEVQVQAGTTLFGTPHYVRRRYPTNPELLHRIATKTGGDAFIATDARALRRSMHSILDRLEKTRFEASMAPPRELFPLWLLPGVLLIGLEALLRVLLLRRFP